MFSGGRGRVHWERRVKKEKCSETFKNFIKYIAKPCVHLLGECLVLYNHILIVVQMEIFQKFQQNFLYYIWSGGLTHNLLEEEEKDKLETFRLFVTFIAEKHIVPEGTLLLKDNVLKDNFLKDKVAKRTNFNRNYYEKIVHGQN